MTLPINPDALTRVPRPARPPAPALGIVQPPSLARVLRERAVQINADRICAAAQKDEADSERWLAVHWIHTAYLARLAMEQACAALRGDEA